MEKDTVSQREMWTCGAIIMIGYAVNGNLAEGENKKGDVISQTFANR